MEAAPVGQIRVALWSTDGSKTGGGSGYNAKAVMPLFMFSVKKNISWPD